MASNQPDTEGSSVRGTSVRTEHDMEKQIELESSATSELVSLCFAEGGSNVDIDAAVGGKLGVESAAAAAAMSCADERLASGDATAATTGHVTSQSPSVTTTDLRQASIDNLLDRHRSEIARELCELTQSARPVSADDTRRAAVTALIDRFVGSVGSTTSTGPQVDPAHSRPEHVLVEVSALVERRPVTSLLQSLVFRSSIENTLRGAVRSLQHNHTAAARRLHPRRDVTDSTAQSASEASSQRDVGVPSGSSDSVHPAASAAIDVPVTPGVDRAQAWIHQIPDPPAVPPEQQQQQETVEVLEQMQHENFIMEISELIHQQLVTTALEGATRDRLERQMANRLEPSSDGQRQRVLQYIRQLPRTGRRRNDFSDLGILPGQHQHQQELHDQLDNISVISATAAVSVPHAYTQSTATLSREMTVLRTQMLELKNLLQLSFDLQLDTQRAIRQEVAAAVSAAVHQQQTDSAPAPAAAAAAAAAGSNQPVSDSGMCLICLDKHVDTVLYQCGHMCLCYTCGMMLRQRGAHCPVCRAPIRDIIRAYRSA